MDLQVEPSDGGLKELVLRWFTETQAQLLLSDGQFPGWFQGFAARKETEDLLRDKAPGCFLIRLSDKALGYILSYKGNSRCRHFVITQNPEGQFIIRGDCQTHGSLTELIEFYKVSPIQPFGEYLTSSLSEVNTEELYDTVNYSSKKTSGVSVQALRTLWDKKNDEHSDSDHRPKVQQQNDPLAAQPPALPLKTKGRKLTGAVSVDTVTLAQGAPPVPKRGFPLGFSLSGSLPDTSSHQSETKTEPIKSERLRGNTPDRNSFTATDTSYPGDLCPPGITYSELTPVESRSRSLPKLNNNPMEEEEDEYSNHLSSPSFTSLPPHSPTPTKRVTCHTYSLTEPRDSSRLSSSRSDLHADDMDVLRANPLYQTSERPGGGSAQQRGTTYAEVSHRQTSAGLQDDTYEQVPGEATAVQGNMYESLEDMKNKKPKSTWGKNNINWKKFLPDYMKK